MQRPWFRLGHGEQMREHRLRLAGNIRFTVAHASQVIGPQVVFNFELQLGLFGRDVAQMAQ